MSADKKEYDYILAIDQGGHASRATIFSLNGDALFSATCDIKTLSYDENGITYIEHDVSELYLSIQTVVSKCQKYLGNTTKLNIKAGFATQRSTIVCWNYKTKEILSNAISWQDTRALNFINNFKSDNELIKTRTGLFLSAHYGASKINWCLHNLKSVKQALDNSELCIGPLSSYLLFSCVIGSRRIVDPANAARTLLLNRESLKWDEGLLALFSIPKRVLPTCVTTKYEYGQLLNWDGVCDVQICTGDQSAAVLSQGIPAENEFTVNIGSGAFVINVNKKDESPARILSGSIYTDTDQNIKAWEGTVNGAGTALNWLQDKYPDENIVEQLPKWLNEYNGEIPLFINGISGVGSPYWKSTLDSRFIGESILPANAIAVIESIIFLITVNINLMKTGPIEIIKVSGGLSIMDELCQKLSDLTKTKVNRTENIEATLQGLFFLLSSSKINLKNKHYDSDVFFPKENASLLNRFIIWKTEMDNE